MVSLVTVFLSLILSGFIEQMILNSNSFCCKLKIPVSHYLFGKNKTWYMLILFPLVESLMYCFISQKLSVFVLVHGYGIGLAWVVGEFPNSFLKRHMFNISEGQNASSCIGRVCQFTFDHLDSTVSVALYLIICPQWPIQDVLYLIPVGGSAHALHNLVCTYVLVKKKQKQP
jgi:hypothetical protein